MDGELDLCPRRGPGLRHHADQTPEGPVCTECGAKLFGPPGSVRGLGRGDLSPRQRKRLGFLAWLREQGKTD